MPSPAATSSLPLLGCARNFKVAVMQPHLCAAWLQKSLASRGSIGKPPGKQSIISALLASMAALGARCAW
jgi:hypothetical protein